MIRTVNMVGKGKNGTNIMGKMAVGAVAFSMLWAGAANAATDGWQISEKSGNVIVLHSGVSKIALQGNAVAMGDVISTGTNGRAVLVRGQEYLVVAPDTRLRIADPAPSGGFVQIIQDVGNVIFKIKRKSTPHFAVQTPYLAAVVKGTTFSVTVGEAGASVQVIEGAVEVKTNDGGASDMVRPGMIAAVSARDLYRLKVDGDTSHVTTSPNAPGTATPATDETKSTAAGAAAPAATPAVAATDPAPAVPVAPPATAATETRIETAIVEAPRSVAELTGGLIEGNATIASPVRVAEVVKDAAAAAVPAKVEPVAASPVEVAQTTPPTPAESATPAPAAPPAVEVAVTPTPATPATPVVVAAAPPSVQDLPQLVGVDEVVAAPSPPAPAPSQVAVVTSPPTVAPPSVQDLPQLVGVDEVVAAPSPPAPAPIQVAVGSPAAAAPPSVQELPVTVVDPESVAGAAPPTTSAQPSFLQALIDAGKAFLANLPNQQIGGPQNRSFGGHDQNGRGKD